MAEKDKKKPEEKINPNYDAEKMERKVDLFFFALLLILLLIIIGGLFYGLLL